MKNFTNKKILFPILAILLALVACISYYSVHKNIQLTEMKDSIFSLFLKNNSDTFKESTDWYEVSIEYPKDNQKVRDEVFQMWEDFAKENQLKDFKNYEEAKKALQLNAEGAKYVFNAKYKLVHSAKTISYVYEVYTFTGGAHGATNIHPITFNEELQYLSAERILPNDLLPKVSALCYDDIMKQKKARYAGGGSTNKDIEDMLKDNSWLLEGTNPLRYNYSNVWYDGDDMVISFGQYQVGPYVEGTYEVHIPMSKI